MNDPADGEWIDVHIWLYSKGYGRGTGLTSVEKCYYYYYYIVVLLFIAADNRNSLTNWILADLKNPNRAVLTDLSCNMSRLEKTEDKSATTILSITIWT